MKKSFKIVIPTVILTVMLVVIMLSVGENENPSEAAEAFKSLCTDDINEELYIFSSVPKDSEEKIGAIWNDILEKYGLQTKNSVVSFDKDGTKKEEWQADDENVYINMTKTSRKESYSLYVNINTNDNNFELQNSITDMEKIFNSQNLKYEVTLSIKGTKLGKLNKDEIFNIKNKLIDKCNANLVSEYDENGTYTCTAFSKDMGRFVRVGGKKVNLNIAVRYSDTDNKTYIYLATPVIRTEV